MKGGVFGEDFDKMLQDMKRDRERREDMRLRYDAEARAKESHDVAMRDARNREQAARDAVSFYNTEMHDPVASTTLGGGRLGTYADAAAAGFGDHNGVFLGTIDGRPVFYPGSSHLLTYAPTGGGKNRDVIVPNLAHVANRSVVVVDVKDGENAYASAGWRKRELGHATHAINPWQLLGVKGKRVNPMQRTIDLAMAGKDTDLEPWKVMEALIPTARYKGDDKWSRMGAQALGAVRIEYLAKKRPHECNLRGLWSFVNSGQPIAELLSEMVDCDIPTVVGVAGALLEVEQHASKQFLAYRGALDEALRVYRPDSVLGEATSSTDFDIASLRHTPQTVYLMVPSANIDAGSQWLSLMVSTLIEGAGAARGPLPVLFLLDELANLPYINAIPRALKLLRGRGVQLWGFCQGRESMKEAGYSEHVIKDFEQQAAVLQMWNVEDPSLLKDIETWSGKAGVAVKTKTFSASGNATFSINVNETTRSVLQPEDIRGIGGMEERGQLLKLAGWPWLFKGQRVAWFENPDWVGGLNDYRALTA